MFAVTQMLITTYILCEARLVCVLKKSVPHMFAVTQMLITTHILCEARLSLCVK